MAENGSKNAPLKLIAVLMVLTAFYLTPAARGQESVPDGSRPAPVKRTAAKAGSRGAPGSKGGDSAPANTGGTRLAISGKSLHLSCTRQLRDLKKNTLECFGNVYIRRPNELLTSDYALMDLN